MADLVAKYFQDELTEAEDKLLSESLANSLEEAQRFGEGLESAYRRYGLPEPEWPGSEDGPKPRIGGISGWWVGLFLTALVGLVSWHFEDRLSDLFDSLVGGESHSTPAVSQGAAERTAPRKKSGKARLVRSNPDLIPEKIHPPAPMDKGQEADPSAWKASSTPIDAAVLAHRPHSELTVGVRRHEPGSVTVMVLNEEGREVALLYEGLLDKGRWVFEWDGRIGSGHPADPGDYRIMVVAGPVTQEKTISIRKRRQP